MRYEYETKPVNCPVCSSEKIAVILYGLPAVSEKLREAVNSGEIIFGGCMITPDRAFWECVVCKTRFHRKVIKK